MRNLPFRDTVAYIALDQWKAKSYNYNITSTLVQSVAGGIKVYLCIGAPPNLLPAYWARKMLDAECLCVIDVWRGYYLCYSDPPTTWCQALPMVTNGTGLSPQHGTNSDNDAKKVRTFCCYEFVKEFCTTIFSVQYETFILKSRSWYWYCKFWLSISSS